MSLYKYKACNAQGKIVKDQIEAASPAEVIQKLSQMELRYISCSEVIEKQKKQKDRSTERNKGSGRRKRKARELADFCGKMATVLVTENSVPEALAIIQETAGKRSLETLARTLSEEMKEGKTLTEAMSSQTPAFPPLLLYMISSGEEKGMLASVMEDLAKYYQHQAKWSQKVKSSLTYPVAVALITLAAVVFMLAFILPNFFAMFQSVALPLPTRILFSISQFLSSFWLWVVVLILAVMSLLRVFFRKTSAKYVLDRWKLRFPGVGKLMRTIYTAEFAAIFSMLYQSGKSVSDCITIAGAEMKNDYVAEEMRIAVEKLGQGGILSQCLQEMGFLDPLFCRMIRNQEDRGNLSNVLASLEDSFRDEVYCTLEGLSTWLEPLLITVLAVIIGFIVVSIILPVFTIYGQLS